MGSKIVKGLAIGLLGLFSLKAFDYIRTFEAITAEGEVISLDTWRGYYVLIQLWNPADPAQEALDRAYSRLKDRYYPLARGIKFVRCALTTDVEGWKRQIARGGESYVVDVVDTAGMRSPLVRQFGISAFPYYIVYNHAGEVAYYGPSIRRATALLRKASRRARD